MLAKNQPSYKGEKQMSNKEKILELYFHKGLKQVEIAKILNISPNAISKVLLKSEDYQKEKEERKKKSKEKHLENTKKIMLKKRAEIKFKNNEDERVIRKMHEEASIELSGNKKLSDRAYRDWNTSAYEYNLAKRRFEFREELGRSYAVKKHFS